jgi:predicted phosphoadenosine phosphosulfate sulfurtransferase
MFSQLATKHDQATCWDTARMIWVRELPQDVDRDLEIVEFLVEWRI